MNLIKKNNILKTIIIYFILSLIFSCSNNVSYSKKLKNLLHKVHTKNSSKKSKNEIKLLATKNIGLKYKGVFYKMKNSNKFYCGFIDNNNNIIKIIKLKNRETVTLFENNLCFIPPYNEKETIVSKEKDECFTLFIGEIPYNGYSSIELEWDCSSSDKVSEKLIDKKYFFFLKKGLETQICNIKLTNNDGQTEDINYNFEDGTFMKKTTTNITRN